MHIDLILTHILLTVHIIIIKKWRNKKIRDRCYLLITNMDHHIFAKLEIILNMRKFQIDFQFVFIVDS